VRGVGPRKACDAASLEAFALDVFAAWREAGEKSIDVWAFETCGKIGGEACARGGVPSRHN